MPSPGQDRVPRGPSKKVFIILLVLLLLLFACFFTVRAFPQLLSPQTPTPTEVPPTEPPPTRPPTPIPTAAPPMEEPTPRPTEPQPTEAPPAPQEPRCVVVYAGADGLNLRPGPGTAYDPPIRTLPNGTQLIPLAFRRVGNPGGQWVQVRVEGTDLVGWLNASGEFVKCNIDLFNLPPGEAPPPAAAAPQPTTPVAEAQPQGDAPGSQPTTPAPVAQPRPRSNLVLSNYCAWYDMQSWDACYISGGDKPLERYNSDDPATIARQVKQALDVGIDGFTLQWFAPDERTDRNLTTLMNQSRGTNFRSSVIFLRHLWPGSPSPTQENIAGAIAYLLDRYGRNPNFLTIDGKPVIFFADMQRVPLAQQGQSPQDAWAAIRARVDPQNNSLWIAEGLDPSYLAVFDGLYVFKITHADYPTDYVKEPRWAAGVRAWQEKTGQPKYWFATVSPGWDDTRSGCQSDVRVASKPHKMDRRDGGFYMDTFASAIASEPDGLWISSFNEWVEGTYLEPSAFWGDRYLNLTRDLLQKYRGQ